MYHIFFSRLNTNRWICVQWASPKWTRFECAISNRTKKNQNAQLPYTLAHSVFSRVKTIVCIYVNGMNECVWQKSNSWKIYKYQISIYVISEKNLIWNLNQLSQLAKLSINTNNSRSIQSIGMYSRARILSFVPSYLSHSQFPCHFSAPRKIKIWIQISLRVSNSLAKISVSMANTWCFWKKKSV